MSKLIINNLHVCVEDKEILKGINLNINDGEIHALMGPNGNGKSTLLSTIMGDPKYMVTEGSITLDGKDVLSMSIDERSKAGLFLAMQYPPEIPGVIVSDFLRMAVNAHSTEENKAPSLYKFILELEKETKNVGLDPKILNRALNDGFSGGEKKKNEIIQMNMLKPTIAMMDEIDSGLDVDAIQAVVETINKIKERNGSALIVSHYTKFYENIKPTNVHVIIDGKILLSGGMEIVEKVDKYGFNWVKTEYGIDVEKPDKRPTSIGLCGVKESYKNGK